MRSLWTCTPSNRCQLWTRWSHPLNIMHLALQPIPRNRDSDTTHHNTVFSYKVHPNLETETGCLGSFVNAGQTLTKPLARAHTTTPPFTQPGEGCHSTPQWTHSVTAVLSPWLGIDKLHKTYIKNKSIIRDYILCIWKHEVAGPPAPITWVG